MQVYDNVKLDGEFIVVTTHLPDRAKKPCPVVVMCHGFTGNRIETRRLFVLLSRRLEEKGMASVRFDYRGCGESSGNFEDFTLSDYIDDAMTTLQFVSENEALDKKRLGIVGYSMGGAVAAVLAGEIKQIRSVVLWAPVAEPLETVKQHAELDFDVNLVDDEMLLEHGGVAVKGKFLKSLVRVKPAKKIRETRARVLICQGSQDEVVEPWQAEEFGAEMIQSGVDHCLLTIEQADHFFSSQKSLHTLLTESTSWFAKTLK